MLHHLCVRLVYLIFSFIHLFCLIPKRLSCFSSLSYDMNFLIQSCLITLWNAIYLLHILRRTMIQGNYTKVIIINYLYRRMYFIIKS